jgi:acetylornithine deacetylase/succinyl-diaminopimelate desuccinylase-like protein
MTEAGSLDAVLQQLSAGREQTLADLVELARIPGVSADGFDASQLERSADAVSALLSAAGMENVEVLRLPGVHPYVVADWLHAPDAPTVLVYAHHDVQPPGRPERWKSPAFEPTVREDGRLYGRGVVDDKAGLMVHLAAVRAWLASAGRLPVNLKLLVEGEEEIGSPNLETFLRLHSERLACDVIVLSDTANLAEGLPSLTTSLRGLVSVDVTVRALDHPVHSGMWGGPVMDAATALARILARVVDDRGQPTIPGLEEDLPKVTARQRAALEALPFDPRQFRADAGLADHMPFTGDEGISVYERLWLRPAVAVTALEAVPLGESANQLIDEARARVSVRIAPGQDPERVRDCVVKRLSDQPPWGVQVDTDCEACASGWSMEAEGPAFDAARSALEAGYGVPTVEIGCGGTIPFVGPFIEVMSGAPAILLGLEDPICNAHGENESLSLIDFDRSCSSAARLYLKLAGR